MHTILHILTKNKKNKVIVTVLLEDINKKLSYVIEEDKTIKKILLVDNEHHPFDNYGKYHSEFWVYTNVLDILSEIDKEELIINYNIKSKSLPKISTLNNLDLVYYKRGKLKTFIADLIIQSNKYMPPLNNDDDFDLDSLEY